LRLLQINNEDCMALIKCPECGSEVSSIAVSCPKCAYPIASASVKDKTVLIEQTSKHIKRQKAIVAGMIFGGLGVNIIFVNCLASSQTSTQYVFYGIASSLGLLVLIIGIISGIVIKINSWWHHG
jgi:hypothetical protein